MGWACAMLMQSLAQMCAAASTTHIVCCGPLRSRRCLGAPATTVAGTAGTPDEGRAGAGSQLPSHDADVKALEDQLHPSLGRGSWKRKRGSGWEQSGRHSV